MYGPHIGTLNVYVDTFGQKRLRWTKSSTQGNKWKRGNFYLDTLYEFSVSFEAVKGKGWSGDIALDDISVSQLLPITIGPFASNVTLLCICYKNFHIYTMHLLCTCI